MTVCLSHFPVRSLYKTVYIVVYNCVLSLWSGLVFEEDLCHCTKPAVRDQKSSDATHSVWEPEIIYALPFVALPWHTTGVTNNYR